MGIGPTSEQLITIRKMISRETAWWYLMKLSNGQWGALWWTGLDGKQGKGLVEDYYSGLAYIGSRKDTVAFIIKELKDLAKSDPVNCPFKERYIKDLAWCVSSSKTTN